MIILWLYYTIIYDYVWIIWKTMLQLVNVFAAESLSLTAHLPSLKCKVLTRDWSRFAKLGWMMDGHKGSVGSWSVQLLNFWSCIIMQSLREIPKVNRNYSRKLVMSAIPALEDDGFLRSRDHEQEHLGLTWLVFGWINDRRIVRCQRPCASVDLELQFRCPQTK